MARRRALGYCQNESCLKHHMGVFLLDPPSQEYHCKICQQVGLLVLEKGQAEGEGEFCSEVRVNFSYDPKYQVYKQTAIVRHSQPPARACYRYVLFCPLIRLEKRALKTAEAILANLNRYAGLLDLEDGSLPSAREFYISFDVSLGEVKEKLKLLSEKLKQQEAHSS